ncbi:zinc-binding dehydrogenase [Streptomyces sp. NPDC058755]|uniref:zinc-binding dehydrogenase n=1 Tax=Streptomyces sp. NPDC058755 TaxID=3346624 RepID=UPI003677BD20
MRRGVAVHGAVRDTPGRAGDRHDRQTRQGGAPARTGAHEVVDHRDVPDRHGAVRELTGGRGVDRVVRTAGTLDQSLRSVAVDGHVALVGSVSGDWSPLDPRLLFGAAAALRAVAVGSRAQSTAMNDTIAAHRLRPVGDRVFPFEEAAEAYRYYESASPLGKVVIGVG